VTGYLQRLAIAATKTGGSIHPVVQPFFASSSQASSPEYPDTEEFSGTDAPAGRRQSDPEMAEAPPRLEATSAFESVSPEPANLVTQPSLPPLLKTQANAHGDAPPNSPSPYGVGLQTQISAPAAHTQTSQRTASRGDNALRTGPSPYGAVGEEAEKDSGERSEFRPLHDRPRPVVEDRYGRAQAEPIPPRGETPDAGRDLHASAERVFAPLLASLVQSPRPAPAIAAGRRAAEGGFRPNTSGAIRQHNSSRLWHSDVAACESNEVQIHIGRIEMTAVPPPPSPPPAAKPQRAAMSLDEYLQRRNGRAR